MKISMILEILQFIGSMCAFGLGVRCLVKWFLFKRIQRKEKHDRIKQEYEKKLFKELLAKYSKLENKGE